jgi:hypothetical protein
MPLNMRMSTNDKNFQKFEKWWQEVRSKGRTRYIWVRGVLGWGVTTGILVALYNNWNFPEKLITAILVNMIFFPIGGYIWGVWTWGTLERKFLKSQNPNDQIKTA